MKKTALDKVRKLNWVLQESVTGVFSYDDLSNILSELMDANVYIITAKGKVLTVNYTIKSDSNAIVDPDTGGEKLPDEYAEELLKITETVHNITADEALKIFKYDYDTYDKLHTIIPIYGAGERLGTVIVTRYSPAFNNEDLILCEYGATVVGLEIRRRRKLDQEREERVHASMLKAIGTLSFSEKEALRHIFDALGSTEGLLIASKVADKFGITRSVIVNALRKLESAGVIESRSLGMKGTHIKILNDRFIDELQRLSF